MSIPKINDLPPHENSINELPHDILYEILDRTTERTSLGDYNVQLLRKATTVCKLWQKTCEDFIYFSLIQKQFSRYKWTIKEIIQSETVKEFYGKMVEKFFELGGTNVLLHEACNLGYESQIHILIYDKRAKINFQRKLYGFSTEFTPLFQAIESGEKYAVVELLKMPNLSFDLKCVGQDSLTYACGTFLLNGNSSLLNVIKILIEDKRALSKFFLEENFYSTRRYCYIDHFFILWPILRDLLANCKEYDGLLLKKSFFHLVCQAEYRDFHDYVKVKEMIREILKDHPKIINSLNNKKKSALHILSERDQYNRNAAYEIIEFLLSYSNIEVNILDKKNQSPLNIIYGSNSKLIDIFKVFLKHPKFEFNNDLLGEIFSRFDIGFLQLIIDLGKEKVSPLITKDLFIFESIQSRCEAGFWDIDAAKIELETLLEKIFKNWNFPIDLLNNVDQLFRNSRFFTKNSAFFEGVFKLIEDEIAKQGNLLAINIALVVDPIDSDLDEGPLPDDPLSKKGRNDF